MKTNVFSIGSGVLGAFFGFLYGEWSVIFGVLLALQGIDYGTGLLASGVEGKLSSKVGFKGIARKVAMLVMVAVGHMVDIVIGQGTMVRDAVMFFYIANELLSITENSGRIGLPVPNILMNAIDVLKGKSANVKIPKDDKKE